VLEDDSGCAPKGPSQPAVAAGAASTKGNALGQGVRKSA